MTRQRARLVGRHHRSEQDALPVAVKHSCAICQVTYYALANQRGACPLCDAQEQVDGLRQALQKSENALAIATAANERLSTEVDTARAIKEAQELLDVEDLVFFKTVLYEFKIEHSVSLKPSHSKGKTVGFIVMPRHGDPWAHQCGSIGGRAIARYFEESLNSVGSAKAMTIMLRAFAHHLPGATG